MPLAFTVVYINGCTKMDPSSATAAHEWIYRPAAARVGEASGVLGGLRFALKDNIDAASWPTTAGCPAFAYTPAEDAVVVRRLLQAGATLVGKTNLDQFACGLNGTRSPYGPVANAFNPDYVSGGSSAGSAFVVATGQVDFSLGTDTAGSGRVPAGLNNIVGFKPSKGWLSTTGVVPAARTVDCVSVFARTVPAAWAAVRAAGGFDESDFCSRPIVLEGEPWPARARVGIPQAPEFFGDQLAQAAWTQALARLQSMGLELVPIDDSLLAEAAELLYGSALVAERYQAIREFFDAHESQVIEPVRSIIAAGRQYSAADLFDAQERLRALAREVAPLWDRMDVLAVPTAPTHYRIDAMQSDPVVLNRNLGRYTNFVNLLDYAAVSVPSSLRADGLPFGITLVAPAGSDARLAHLGARYHACSDLPLGATQQRLSPQEANWSPFVQLARQGAEASASTSTPSTSSLPSASSASTSTCASAIPATVLVAVVGAHLSGMPRNGQLTERGASLVKRIRTAPDYQLFALPDTTPPKPGLLRVAPGAGHAIELEVWEMPMTQYGSFVALIPAPLGIGTLRLEDDSTVQGFVCEPLALEGATNISALGGWRAYIASRLAPPSSSPAASTSNPRTSP
ncbi:MAG: allophanate hydrolase [Burkholderiales bacterium]